MVAAAEKDSLGLRVRIERVRRGVSQEWLARQADVGQHNVSRLERGLDVPADRQKRILRVLSLSSEAS